MLPSKWQRLYYQHVSYLWNFVLRCATSLLGLWFVLQLPGKQNLKNMNRKRLVEVVTGSGCPWYDSQQISPADDLQIPGRCGVESQRTGTRTTPPICFSGNSVTHPPASCSPNLGHVGSVVMNWPTGYLPVNLAPHLTKHP